MTPRLLQRRARLRAEYGFDFPDDFYRFWEFANRLSPLDPLHALDAPLGLTLVGPFELLAGRFDGRVPRHSLLLHWRYHDDPPEFFTVLAGGDDGLHWGHYLDDPDADGVGCVASYYAQDAFELSVEGDTLFEALRLHLEFCHADCEADAVIDPGEADHAAALGQLDHLRQRLVAYATGDRPEVGEAYTERYAGVSAREQRVVAMTMEGMGAVVPPQLYRPLATTDRALWRLLRKKKLDPDPFVEEARRALRDGFPGTALVLGKNLWATVGDQKMAHAVELLDAAYEGLNRPALRRVLQTHVAHRTLASVDILDEGG